MFVGGFGWSLHLFHLVFGAESISDTFKNLTLGPTAVMSDVMDKILQFETLHFLRIKHWLGKLYHPKLSL